jgi:predicted Zn-dependent protease
MQKLIVLAVLFALLANAPQSPAQDIGSAFSQMGNALSQMNTAITASQSTMSVEDEYYLGRAVAANILEQYQPYLKNPALTTYVNKICRAITLNSAKPTLFNGYHVMILDSDELNAFASSGGHIFITRGLVNAATSEDALAAVIAHEIAHIQLRHGLSLVKDMKLTNDLTAVAERSGQAAAAATGIEGQQANMFATSVRDMVNTMVKNGYSRPQEFAADEAAVTLLIDAGYDPLAFVDVFQSLQRALATSPSNGLSSTHPTPTQRLSNIERLLRTRTKSATRSSREPRFKAAR